MTNAFRDAHELLSGPVSFWVFAVEEIYVPNHGAYEKMRLCYNWRSDVYCFLVDSAFCVTFGHPDEADWFYTVDPSLLRLYGTLMQGLQPILDHLATEDEVG